MGSNAPKANNTVEPKWTKPLKRETANMASDVNRSSDICNYYNRRPHLCRRRLQSDGLLHAPLPRFCLRRAVFWGVVMESSPNVARRKKNNGNVAHPVAGVTDLDLNELLDALHAMQAGDFSVRLPGSKTGVA